MKSIEYRNPMCRYVVSEVISIVGHHKYIIINPRRACVRCYIRTVISSLFVTSLLFGSCLLERLQMYVSTR